MNCPSLSSISFEALLENIPVSIYWKNKNGVYLDNNDYAKYKMQSVGLSSASPAGKTDCDFFPASFVNLISENDMEVIQNNHSLVIEEPLILPNGSRLIQISSKKPFRDHHGDIAGIIGATLDITHLITTDEKTSNCHTVTAKNKPPQKNTFSTPNNKVHSSARFYLTNFSEKVYLTKREAECAYQIVMGKTAKEIAGIFNISPRTVEFHMDKIKFKLGCYKRSTLIEMLLSKQIFSDLQNFLK